MCGTALAASSRSTVMRTSSEPARASAATWSTVAATSAVSVLVIDWTTIGAPPPTLTPPTITGTVSRRRGPSGRSVTGASPVAERDAAPSAGRDSSNGRRPRSPLLQPGDDGTRKLRSRVLASARSGADALRGFADSGTLAPAPGAEAADLEDAQARQEGVPVSSETSRPSASDGASAAAPQLSQIRNSVAPGSQSSPRSQATYAFFDSMRWAKLCSTRKSSAR